MNWEILSIMSQKNFFAPLTPPLTPPGGPQNEIYGVFSTGEVVTRSNESLKCKKVLKSSAEKNFPHRGVKLSFGGVGGSIGGQFSKFRSKSKSVSLPNSIKVICVVEIQSNGLQYPILSF